jgi:predicted Fe-Mo cluster-binding NifX family protein
MRIAIPSDDGITVASHTGRASGFVIFDLNEGQPRQVEYRTNRYTGHALGQCNEDEDHSHNHHHHSHDGLLGALHDCNIMLAHGMGPRLVNDLASRNIQVIFCDEIQAEDAVRKLASGGLNTRDRSNCCHK